MLNIIEFQTLVTMNSQCARFSRALCTTNFGRFSNAEDDFILKHIESNNGMYDLDYLKHKLMRPNDVIYPRIEFLSGNPSPKSVDKFTLGEDIMITKYVFNNKIPKGIDEIKEIGSKRTSWKRLEPSIRRERTVIANRWNKIIYPRILAHLNGRVYSDWKKEFFQYIIDNKFISATDIDEKYIEEKWGFIPKRKLIVTATDFAKKHRKKDVPLYQHISENIHRYRPSTPSQETLDFIEAFKKLSDEY